MEAATAAAAAIGHLLFVAAITLAPLLPLPLLLLLLPLAICHLLFTPVLSLALAWLFDLVPPGLCSCPPPTCLPFAICCCCPHCCCHWPFAVCCSHRSCRSCWPGCLTYFPLASAHVCAHLPPACHSPFAMAAPTAADAGAAVTTGPSCPPFVIHR